MSLLSPSNKLQSLQHQKAGILTVLLLMALLAAGCSQETTEAPANPPGNYDTPLRIGYYEGGPYFDYAESFRATINGLAALGWMEPLEIPAFENPEDMASIWHFVAENSRSDYLEFVENAFWSADWEDGKREIIRQDALQRLAEQQDIDLVLAMGTWAGQDLVNNLHHTATLNLTSSNPVQAGIISSPESSGYEHVLVEVDPNRYLRNIRLYHEVVGFQKLGVVYEDSPDGRIYANYEELLQASAGFGFEIIECHAEDTNLSEDEAYQNVQRCYHELAPQIDALWIGAHRGENYAYLPQSIKPIMAYDIPTWSNQGSEAVKRGVLMSIWQADFAYAGGWYAEIIGQILNGALPGDLNQTLELPQHIVLNLETARRIGFEFPPGILEIADHVYETIEGEYEIQESTAN
ncbi:MAG: hypothetical protein JXA25_00795 [Anaerolineales bacterium]|nr:hypothetical protein [Anaerolineales bacterium]